MGKHEIEKEKKKRSPLKIIGIVFLVLIILIVIIAGIGLGFVYSKLGKMNVEEIDKTDIGIDEETQEIKKVKTTKRVKNKEVSAE